MNCGDVDYIVALTTIPRKFEYMCCVVDSLLAQTLPPATIVVSVACVYDFRLRGATIPDAKLRAFAEHYGPRGVLLYVSHTDHGPGTKLLGLLECGTLRNVDPDRAYVVLVDDDHLYHPEMLATFDAARRASGDSLEVASFYTYMDRGLVIGQGADGFFMRVRTLDRFAAFYARISDIRCVKYHDDYYISFYFRTIGKSIIHLRAPGDDDELVYTQLPTADVDALQHLEGPYSRATLTERVGNVLREIEEVGGFRFEPRPLHRDGPGAPSIQTLVSPQLAMQAFLPPAFR
jgi:hypothetical protein